MTAPMVLDEDDALDLLALLVTAARTQVDEAREYGPLRLLTAAHRLADAMGPRCSPETARLLAEVMPKAPALAVPREGSDAYVERLDSVCAAVGRFVRDRYSSDD